MKNNIFAAFFVLSTFLPARAAEPVEAKSKITEVTVFLQSAQVTREAKVLLKKGENTVQFSGLATGIDPKSIQAAAPNIVLINSVYHEINYQKGIAAPAKVVRLQDSLELVKDRLARIGKENLVLDQEKTMVLKNQSIAGKETGLSIDELRKTADFFRSRLTDINQRLLKNKQESRTLNQTKSRINRQLKEWNQRKNQPSNDIFVKLNSDYDRTVTLAIRFLVSDAGWVPRYDLRAKDTQGPIQLDYRADVYQNTGIDWKQIKLTLSSGNPNQGGTKPELQQWNLYPATPGYATTSTINAEGTVGGVYDAKKKEERTRSGGELMSQKLTLADYTTVKVGAVTAEFAISIKQDVPTGASGRNRMQQVNIQESELPAIYQHFAVPKLDKDAFLVARVTDWESLQLLPGSVNIFFEGTYIAESYLNPESTRDTLDFSLGRDKKVIIQRELLKSYNKRSTIGFNRERTFGYEITVRNTKSSAVRLVLNDQLPISQDDKITVKVMEVSGARRDETTGKLTWELDLQPSETKKLKLIFSVKHPKNSTVPGI